MIDPTEKEIEAMQYAGETGGEYLESLEKSDLAALSPEEYMTFIECVITGYTDKLRALEATTPLESAA